MQPVTWSPKCPTLLWCWKKDAPLYTGFKVSCHPDFNCFWHLRLRAVGWGRDTALQCEWNKRNPSAACFSSCRQSAMGATADEDGSCCRCSKRQVASCSLLPPSPCVDSIAVCPAESLCGYHNLSPWRPRVWWKAGLPPNLFLLIYVSQVEKT